MVDSDEEETAENSPENFIDIESTDPIIPVGLSLVVIKDHNPIIFPPSNHENLISIPEKLHEYSNSLPSPSYDDHDSTSSLSSSDCFSPSDTNSPQSSPLRIEKISAQVAKCCWWKLGLEICYRKVNGVLLLFRSFRLTRGVLSTFQSPATMASVLCAFLYFWWRRRRRQQLPRSILAEKSHEHLLSVIKEKDERITQLLNQISRMNEVLLALHRVPSSKND